MHCDLQRRERFQWGQCFNIWQCLDIWLNLSEKEDNLIAAGLWKFQAWTEFLDEQMGLYCQTSLKLPVSNSHGSCATDGHVCEYTAVLLWVNLIVSKVKLTCLFYFRQTKWLWRRVLFLHISNFSCMILSITHLLAVLNFLDQTCKNSVCAAISFLQT